MSFLLRNLLRFGQLLHGLGVDTPAGRMLDVASALAHIDIGRRSDFYFTLRSFLIHRPQDFALFDQAFLERQRVRVAHSAEVADVERPHPRPLSLWERGVARGQTRRSPAASA